MKFKMVNNSLYHHGVKGQKWGVRRYQNKDGSLTSTGKKRYNKTASRDHSKSNKTELAIMTMRIANDLSNPDSVNVVRDTTRLIKAGKSYVASKVYDKDREGCKIDSKTNFRLKKSEFSIEQDAARVNPLVHNFDANTKNNCMLCTATYDLRRRGYEVNAKKASYGYLPDDITAWYPKAKVNTITGVNPKGKPSVDDMIAKTKAELTGQGNGARGNLMIKWRGMRGGHSVAYEIKNDKLIIIDAQTGKIHTNPDRLLRRSRNEIRYARLDNVEFNTKTIGEVAR